MYNSVTVFLQIHSGICVPKIIKIEHDLIKLLRNKKVQFLCLTMYYRQHCQLGGIVEFVI